VQVYTYYIAFPKDRNSTKILVYGFMALELVQTIIATRDAFMVFASNFGNPVVLLGINNSWAYVTLIGGIAGFAAQIFFSYRLLAISQWRKSSFAIVLISIISFAAAVTSAIFIHREHDLSGLKKKSITIVVATWPGTGALCDILIAIFMTHNLSRRASGFPATNVMLTKLIRVTIETGIANASVAFASFVLFIAFRNEFYFIVPAVMMSKVYGNSVLVVLNNRLEIVNGRSEIQRELEINTFSLSERKVGFGRVFGRIPFPTKSVPPVDKINIKKEVWTDIVVSENTTRDIRNSMEGRVESGSIQKKVFEIA